MADRQSRRGRSTIAVVLVSLLSAAGTAALSPPSGAVASVAPSPAVSTAAQAYVWGLPLVISMRTVQTFAAAIGVNRLVDQDQLSTPSSRTIIEPNADTLYAVAILDLRNGPQELTVPKVSDRYYSYQFLDMYTRDFAYVGTRATGGRPGTWVVAAPGWAGPVPAGATLLRAPTPIVFVIGRFLVGGRANLPSVRRAMARVSLIPLNGTSNSPADHTDTLGAPAGKPQTAAAAGAAFFNELATDVVLNPPTRRSDQRELARLAAAGMDFTPNAPVEAGPASSTLAQGVAAGAAEIRSAVDSSHRSVNGWTTTLHTGRYGHDFLLRAAVAQSGWGANISQEATYATSRRDSIGQPYSGSSNYRLVFPKGSVPPVRAFWSLTVYGPDGFLVANAAGRYAIGSDTPGLHYEGNGSLEVTLQNALPTGHGVNWLPVPTGRFYLVLRMYLPEPLVTTGHYRIPGVLRAGSATSR